MSQSKTAQRSLHQRPSSPSQKVQKLSARHHVPQWLRSLWRLQRRTKLLFAAILCLLPIVYTLTVSTQDRWKREHGQLKRLQAQIDKQALVTQTLEHNLAQAAERTSSGAISADPSQIVFVPASTPRPPKPAHTAPKSPPTPAHRVVGY
jgi:hypothetical protein